MRRGEMSRTWWDQADMEAGPHYTGGLYEEKARGILASRGQKVVIHSDGKIEVVGSLGDLAALENEIHHGDWNDYVIIAKGNHLQQFINGHADGPIPFKLSKDDYFKRLIGS